MRYEGNTCPGCGEVFKQDDDVVVCPECATAQHRECYNKKGECVNARFHSEDFQWQPEKGVSVKSTSTLTKQETDENLMDCPVCHNKCNPDKGYCEKCGTKFVMFGVNLAKEIQKEQEKINAKENGGNENETTVPPYKPPFELGVGEGFEQQENRNTADSFFNEHPNAEQVQQSVINALGGSDEKYADDGEQKLYFKGPFAPKDKIDGVSVNAIGTFVRNEALRYIEKFRRIKSGGIVFNWGALLFSPFWFFYRKLYKPGIIFMTAEILISIFTTYFSYELVAEMVRLGIPVGDEMTYESLYSMINEKMVQLSGYMLVCMIVLVIIHIVAGFMADRLYSKYVVDKVRIMEKKNTLNEAYAYASKSGGVSFIAVMGSFFVYMIFNYIIGMFFA